MPCYFDKMISKYFQCPFDEATDRVHDLENDYETRETLFYDFIDSTVYNFGPASYTVNTPTINKLCFEMWRKEAYAIITKDIDINNLTEIEMDKFNMFWEAIYNRNLMCNYITAPAIESLFNQCPVIPKKLH